ncbi:MAG: AlbA family DNA-binding domain-containing protein [Thermoplasmatota archaeon]
MTTEQVLSEVTGGQLPSPLFELKNPLAPEYLDYLTAQTKEHRHWDFKRSLSIAKDSDFAKIAKDIFAFCNAGGGYLLIGWEERETGGYEPVGVPDAFHVDQASMQGKFNAYSDHSLELEYHEFARDVNGASRKFAAIYVPPATTIIKPTKQGVYAGAKGKDKVAFEIGLILTRRGTSSVPATPAEVKLIEKRCQRSDYQLSLISGQADDVQETLHSNLFSVQQLPERIYVAEVRAGTKVPGEVRRRHPFVTQGSTVYMFEEPRSTSLKSLVNGTPKSHVLSSWRKDPDNHRVFVWLLKQAIGCLAESKGMRHYYHRDRIYHPYDPAQGEKIVNWKGLHRGAPRKVAYKMYAQQLKQEIHVHPAAEIDFVVFGDLVCLQLVPTFVLTWDGAKPVEKFEVGSIITRLLNNNYNSAYLRDVYFWLEQLLSAPDYPVMAAGGLQIATRAIQVNVSQGLIGDQMASLDDEDQSAQSAALQEIQDEIKEEQE